MAPKLPSAVARRPSSNLLFSSSPSRATLSATQSIPCTASPPTLSSHPALCQSRPATYIHRPRRPYTFTQLIQLSDGSTFTTRTTSPSPIHRSDRDTRNHITWQPSEKSLQDVEVDEAGKLAAFRQRFGRGFDLAAATEGEVAEVADALADAGKLAGKTGEEMANDVKAAAASKEGPLDLGDLISGYAANIKEEKVPDWALRQEKKKSSKKGKK